MLTCAMPMTDVITILNIYSGSLDLVKKVNQFMVDHIYFSTQKRSNYDKMMSLEQFKTSKKYLGYFIDNFMSVEYVSLMTHRLRGGRGWWVPEDTDEAHRLPPIHCASSL